MKSFYFIFLALSWFCCLSLDLVLYINNNADCPNPNGSRDCPYNAFSQALTRNISSKVNSDNITVIFSSSATSYDISFEGSNISAIYNLSFASDVTSQLRDFGDCLQLPMIRWSSGLLSYKLNTLRLKVTSLNFGFQSPGKNTGFAFDIMNGAIISIQNSCVYDENQGFQNPIGVINAHQSLDFSVDSLFIHLKGSQPLSKTFNVFSASCSGMAESPCVLHLSNIYLTGTEVRPDSSFPESIFSLRHITNVRANNLFISNFSNSADFTYISMQEVNTVDIEDVNLAQVSCDSTVSCIFLAISNSDSDLKLKIQNLNISDSSLSQIITLSAPIDSLVMNNVNIVNLQTRMAILDLALLTASQPNISEIIPLKINELSIVNSSISSTILNAISVYANNLTASNLLIPPYQIEVTQLKLIQNELANSDDKRINAFSFSCISFLLQNSTFLGNQWSNYNIFADAPLSSNIFLLQNQFLNESMTLSSLILTSPVQVFDGHNQSRTFLYRMMAIQNCVFSNIKTSSNSQNSISFIYSNAPLLIMSGNIFTDFEAVERYEESSKQNFVTANSIIDPLLSAYTIKSPETERNLYGNVSTLLQTMNLIFAIEPNMTYFQLIENNTLVSMNAYGSWFLFPDLALKSIASYLFRRNLIQGTNNTSTSTGPVFVQSSTAIYFESNMLVDLNLNGSYGIGLPNIRIPKALITNNTFFNITGPAISSITRDTIISVSQNVVVRTYCHESIIGIESTSDYPVNVSSNIIALSYLQDIYQSTKYGALFLQMRLQENSQLNIIDNILTMIQMGNVLPVQDYYFPTIHYFISVQSLSQARMNIENLKMSYLISTATYGGAGSFHGSDIRINGLCYNHSLLLQPGNYHFDFMTNQISLSNIDVNFTMSKVTSERGIFQMGYLPRTYTVTSKISMANISIFSDLYLGYLKQQASAFYILAQNLDLDVMNGTVIVGGMDTFSLSISSNFTLNVENFFYGFSYGRLFIVDQAPEQFSTLRVSNYIELDLYYKGEGNSAYAFEFNSLVKSIEFTMNNVSVLHHLLLSVQAYNISFIANTIRLEYPMRAKPILNLYSYGTSSNPVNVIFNNTLMARGGFGNLISITQGKISPPTQLAIDRTFFTVTLQGVFYEGFSDSLVSFFSMESLLYKEYYVNVTIKDSIFWSGTADILESTVAATIILSNTINFAQTLRPFLNFEHAGRSPSNILLNNVIFYGAENTTARVSNYKMIYVSGSNVEMNSVVSTKMKTHMELISSYLTLNSLICVCSILRTSLGGCLYLSGTGYNITNGVFQYNVATAGGAIYLEDPLDQRFISENTIIQTNSVNRYGNNLASQPYYIKLGIAPKVGVSPLLMKYASIEYKTITNDEGIQVNITNCSAAMFTLLDFEVYLEDYYHQRIIYDRDEYPTVHSSPSNTLTINQNETGTMIFVVLPAPKHTARWDMAFTYAGVTKKISLTFTSRDCIDGEYYNNQTGTCELCLNNMYSLSSVDPCDRCPSSYIDCLGGNVMNVTPNFWRAEGSDKLYSCLNDKISRCRGGVDPNDQCVYGYAGALCQACNYSLGYTAGSGGICMKCSSNLFFIFLKIFGSLMFSYSLELYFIYSMFISNKNYIKLFLAHDTVAETKIKIKQKYYFGIQLNLLMNFIQFTSIIFMYAQYTYLDVFSLVSQIKSTLNFFSDPSTQQSSSVECLLLALGVDPNDITYFKIQYWEILPFVKLVLTFIIIYILHWNGKIKRLKDTLITSTFALILNEQPSLVLNLARFSSCFLTETDGYGYVQIQPAIKCSDPYYQNFLLYYVMPALIFWGGVIPLSLFVVLFRKRDMLNDIDVRKTYGGMINSYKGTVYFWGLITMICKLVFILPLSLITDSTAAFQTSVIIMLLYFTLHLLLEPYNHKEFLRIEKFSILTYIITLFLLANASTEFYGKMSLKILLLVGLINVAMLIYILSQIVRKYRMSKRSGRFTITNNELAGFLNANEEKNNDMKSLIL